MPVAKRNRAEELVADISAELANVREHISTGGCADWGAYCAATGQYNVLLQVRNRLTEFFTAEDDEE